MHYRILSEKGNPSIRSLARVLDALGIRLTVIPSLITPVVEDDNQPVATQDGQTQHIAALGEELSDLRHLMTKEFAAMHTEAEQLRKVIASRSR